MPTIYALNKNKKKSKKNPLFIIIFTAFRTVCVMVDLCTRAEDTIGIVYTQSLTYVNVNQDKLTYKLE